MCTAISLFRNNHYFGRNLDVDFSFKEQVVITPKNFLFNLKNGEQLKIKYGLLGMASVINEIPLYYEACNTCGLAMAGLNFPEVCKYNEPDINKYNLAICELIPYILGNFKNLLEVKEFVRNLNITNLTFSKDIPNSPLHYIISDNKESIVLEQTKDGLNIYNNPYNVLTNNPPFPYHLWNINNYRNLNSKNGENLFSKDFNLNEYCVGLGSVGLPGDTSSASRFVRATFNLHNLEETNDIEKIVTDFFHVLDSVSMVKGSTITKTNKLDITLYSCCIDCSNLVYYYKLYDNNRINAIKVTDELLNKDTITCFDLKRGQDINYQN